MNVIPGFGSQEAARCQEDGEPSLFSFILSLRNPAGTTLALPSGSTSIFSQPHLSYT